MGGSSNSSDHVFRHMFALRKCRNCEFVAWEFLGGKSAKWESLSSRPSLVSVTGATVDANVHSSSQLHLYQLNKFLIGQAKPNQACIINFSVLMKGSSLTLPQKYCFSFLPIPENHRSVGSTTTRSRSVDLWSHQPAGHKNRLSTR